MLTRDPRAAEPCFFCEAHEVAPGVLMFANFVNNYALVLGDELVLVDPGFEHLAPTFYEAVRAWTKAPLVVAVYTHGHADHAFGLRPFLEAGERPLIVAQENCMARFRRYERTHGWNAFINQRQFSLPQPMFPRSFVWPNLTFQRRLIYQLAKHRLEFTAARGETDDACYLFVPEKRYLFCGDLIIWMSPNCGNPQKVQRYPEEWAEALEAMAGLGAEYLFPGHGLVVCGEDAVRTVLLDTARYLRVLIEQVIERMNRGEQPEEIFHGVEPDPELSQRPYLRPTYDHPKFIVRNLLRLWGGWWNGNAADLLPARWEEQAREVVRLAGGAEAVVARGRELLAAGETKLAAHLAEWVTRADPSGRAGQELKRDVYAQRLAEETSLMAQGIYRAAMNDARRALGEEPLPPSGASLGLVRPV
ncbi:MAG: MBL fold metallo-hydrolase [Candidatus Binatia bacterium]|nr:MBL fold metallo-hydrolase [Candidatus Binatia bacterium]